MDALKHSKLKLDGLAQVETSTTRNAISALKFVVMALTWVNISAMMVTLTVTMAVVQIVQWSEDGNVLEVLKLQQTNVLRNNFHM